MHVLPHLGADVLIGLYMDSYFKSANYCAVSIVACKSNFLSSSTSTFLQYKIVVTPTFSATFYQWAPAP